MLLLTLNILSPFVGGYSKSFSASEAQRQQLLQPETELKCAIAALSTDRFTGPTPFDLKDDMVEKEKSRHIARIIFMVAVKWVGIKHTQF